MASCALDEYLAALQISSSDKSSIEKTRFVLVDDNMKTTPDFLVASKIRPSRGVNRTHSLPTVSSRWINAEHDRRDSSQSPTLTHSTRKIQQVTKRCRWDDLTSDCTSSRTTGSTKNDINNNHKHTTHTSRKRRSHDQFVALPTRSAEEDLGCSRVLTDDSFHRGYHHHDQKGEQHVVAGRGGRNHHYQQQPSLRTTIQSSSTRSLPHYR